MDGYIVIPEFVVKQAAASIPEDLDNSFLKVLKAGEEYRQAGLTPVYVLDPNYKDLVVIAQEIYGKKLH
jgi:hypothetical protein